jgi:hypothetical protein
MIGIEGLPEKMKTESWKFDEGTERYGIGAGIHVLTIPSPPKFILKVPKTTSVLSRT